MSGVASQPCGREGCREERDGREEQNRHLGSVTPELTPALGVKGEAQGSWDVICLLPLCFDSAGE